MRDADFTASRRGFLLQLAGIAAGATLAPSVLDAALEIADRLAPRRLYVPAPRSVIVLNAWKEVSFRLTDAELQQMLVPDVAAIVAAPRWSQSIDHDMMRQAMRAIDKAFVPGTQQPGRVRVFHDPRHSIDGGGIVVSIDQVGADPRNVMRRFTADPAVPDFVPVMGALPFGDSDVERQLQRRYAIVAAEIRRDA